MKNRNKTSLPRLANRDVINSLDSIEAATKSIKKDMKTLTRRYLPFARKRIRDRKLDGERCRVNERR